MESGLLVLETSPTHAGLVRIRVQTDNARSLTDNEMIAADDAEQRLALHFHDVDAARMHAHQAMRRHLVDVDAGTYRIPLIEARAATPVPRSFGVTAIRLKYHPVYIDPTLTDPVLDDIAQRVAAKTRHKAAVDRIWQIVGGLAVAFLVLLGTSLGRN